MLTNWHEILLRQAQRPYTSKTKSPQKKSADTSEEKSSSQPPKPFVILMLLVSLVMLLGPTLLLLLERTQNLPSFLRPMSTILTVNSSPEIVPQKDSTISKKDEG